MSVLPILEMKIEELINLHNRIVNGYKETIKSLKQENENLRERVV